MPTAIARLPDRQLDQLRAAYGKAGAQKRRQLLLGLAIGAAAMLLAAWVAEVRPDVFYQHSGNFFSYIGRIFHLDNGEAVYTNPAEWLWGWKKWSLLMAETLLISYVGTVTGAIFAFLLCFLASANLVASPWLRFAVKRLLEFLRTVPDIVFALIFVVAFGLGPFPGVLAIALHTMGALGKQFTEIVENIDLKPVEGLRSAGANFASVIRFAVVPQILAQFATYALLRFEVNVRGASVMGFVGAGGIGQDLIEAIRKFYYSDVSAILVMIIAVVFVIDMATEQLRHRLTGFGGRH